MMRLVHDEFEAADRPIPFPGRQASPPLFGERIGPTDSIRMVEDALGRVQAGIDEMGDLLTPIPFQSADDDGPRAA
ncbi:MAG: hypothetical protein AAGK04_01610 [Planctomycetota bacterium]